MSVIDTCQLLIHR